MISEAAAHGYPSKKRLKEHKREIYRRRARAAGLASGAARRARATGRRQPHQRSRQQALALAYPVRQVSRARFDEIDARWRAENGLQPSARGLETEWLQYLSHWRATRAKGHEYTTTNSRRARSLEKLGRPRCRRTVQRVDRRLEAKGLIARVHVKRQRDRSGECDYLRIRVLPFVTLPSAARATTRRVVSSGSNDSDCDRRAIREGGPAPPGGVAAPDGRQTEERRPSAADCNGSYDGEEPPAHLVDRLDGDLVRARRLWALRPRR